MVYFKGYDMSADCELVYNTHTHIEEISQKYFLKTQNNNHVFYIRLIVGLSFNNSL